MKVSELIDALDGLDPNAVVLFHANNHTSRPDDRAVVLSGPGGVMVGNFTAESHSGCIGLMPRNRARFETR